VWARDAPSEAAPAFTPGRPGSWGSAAVAGGSALGFFLHALASNARGEPRLKAGAERTLEGVGSTALFGAAQTKEHCWRSATVSDRQNIRSSSLGGPHV
jgi:hypothetical protein